MSDTHTALIIDDEPDIRELIAMSLDRIGLDTHTAANLDEARHLLERYQFDVCLTDMKLPDGDGIEFVKYLQQIQPTLPVAVITAHGNMGAAVEAMKNGAFDFVSKPVDIGLLRNLVTQAIRSNTPPEKNETDYPVSTSGQKSEPAAEFTRDSCPEAAKVNNPQLTDADNALLQDTARERIRQVKPSNTNSAQGASSLARLSGQHTDSVNSFEHIGKEKLVGRSQPMQELRKMISKVARTNAPVWITGESGTGKELIARLVHENGPRADAPFIAINCGAIPSELMESEMFGHRKGSFTGAHDHHDGLFRRADGGTLFLDEVAELPLHMQVKLLRTIQERSIRPVGSSDEVSVNVRLLSASHKDLGKEVDEGHFRHDLYYRLNVICIRSPSLRQRSEDIVEIARYILRSITALEKLNKPAVLTPEAEDLLSTYSFPGNVRELENILERAVALCDNAEIRVGDLNISTNLPDASQPTSDSRAPDERKIIIDMLLQTRWNRKMAAERLGMTYRQLRYRIQQYRIDEDESGDSPPLDKAS